MKIIGIGSLFLLLLSGCTVAPSPVTTALFPGLLPQAKPRPVSQNYYVPQRPAANSSRVIARAPIVAPPQVRPTVAPKSIPTVRSGRSIPKQSTLVSKPEGNLAWLARRVYDNETQADLTNLIQWNDQGDFVTLGYGRFIWYPAGQRGNRIETFPAFLAYAESSQYPLPRWLAQRPTRGGPWPNKAAFTRAQKHKEMAELREFLLKTGHLQASFMSARLQHNLPAMANNLPLAARSRVLQNFRIMEQSPGGLYPMLDYVQFKGDGTNPNERYNGYGWGLLQVLQNMETVSPGQSALAEFMRSADDVLIRRVANAPIEKREAHFLSVWQQRIQSYVHASTLAAR